jgi:hypothetical protein
LFLVHRFLSPWWRRRQVPPKRRFLQEPHGVTTQKTPFFRLTLVPQRGAMVEDGTLQKSQPLQVTAMISDYYYNFYVFKMRERNFIWYMDYPKVPEIWILPTNDYEYIEIPIGVSPHSLLESVWQAASSWVVGFLVSELISIVMCPWVCGFPVADLREQRVCIKFCF